MNQIKYLIFITMLLINGCNKDTAWYNYMEATNWSGGFEYPNGKIVGKFCRTWYDYTYYRPSCKSQRCFNEYEENYDNALLVREIGRERYHELCSEEAIENGMEVPELKTNENSKTNP